MKALIDDLRRWNTARKAHLFFGVRKAVDLYDLEAMQETARRYPWLTVVPAVSEDYGYGGENASLPDLLERYGNWFAHDVYESGSPDMIRATVARFRELGVSPEQIRYDEF